VASLPAGCQAAIPASTATIAFVAEGRAWAVGPDGKGLTCLFEASDPGPFAWGPRSDRVLLGGLAVRGVGSTASRSAGSTEPSVVSWGRPTGLAVAFVDPGATKIEKALVGKATIQDVSPFDNVTYQDVVYHPSGLALAMVLTDSDGSSIWVASNTGKDPKRIVWSREQTIFGPVAWRSDGNTLYYAAHLKNGTRMIAGADLKSKRVNAGLWVGKQDVLRLVPAPNGEAVGIDTGTDCDDRTALVSNLDQKAGRSLLRNAAGPTTFVGWIDDATVLVEEGGCTGPMKLWRVELGTGGTTRLVFDAVDRAAVRIPDPTPPPPLPEIGVNEGLA